MNKKLRVVLLFGGKSVEHEVSILSAKSIYEAIDKNKYEIALIGIDKSGYWRVFEDAKVLEQKSIASNTFRHSIEKASPTESFWRGNLNPSHSESASRPDEESPRILLRQPAHQDDNLTKGFLDPDCGKVLVNSDVIFPVLHGTYGEDGSVQGFLKLMNKPFVGAGVLGSALGMDKEVQKRLLLQAGIKTAKFLTYRRHSGSGNWPDEESPEIPHSVRNDTDLNFETIKKQLGLPFFVKPANSGSSVGASKVKNEADFLSAIKEAFKYDNKILIEEFIEGREIECSVLGNDQLVASLPGEVITNHEFYSYEAKYLDENGAVLKIPAELDKATVKKIQDIAVKTFQVLECSGMARVDFFLRDNRLLSDRTIDDFKSGNSEILVNEINTIPGFTSISMYPKLWEASGLSYSDLIDKLIALAMEKFEKEKQLDYSRE